MYRILGKGGWQTNGLFILPWMGGMVDLCIILQTLAGGVRQPRLHGCSSNDGQLNARIVQCNSSWTCKVQINLQEKKPINWTIGVERHGWKYGTRVRMQVCSLFQRKINMHGNKHIDPMSMHKLVDRFSTKLMVLNGWSEMAKDKDICGHQASQIWITTQFSFRQECN